MIHWAWLLLVFFAGAGAGAFLIALLAAGATESVYRAGFQEGLFEGHTEAFKAGLKELEKVG